MTEDDAKKKQKNAAVTVCPRCGSPPVAPRKPTPARPFLSTSNKLTCSACGLDYEKGERPWPRGRSED